MTITVVIPCWNCASTIARAVSSALENDALVIVVDDGSTDSSVDELRAFEGKIQIISGVNVGAPGARNIGFDRVETEFVLFLDADDYIAPGSLQAWAQIPDKDMIFGPHAFETQGVVQKVQCSVGLNNELILRSWFGGDYIAHCSVLWRADFLRHIGGWNESLRRNEDGELVMRALILGARVGWCDQGLGVYVQHDDPGRVSKRSSPDILLEQIGMFAELEDLARRQGLQLGAAFFAPAFYGIACEAYNSDYAEVGAAALAQARARGLRGHPGTWRHRIAASALGLEQKTRLAKWLRLAHGAHS